MKYQLTERKVLGQLETLEQIYRINYMPKDGEMCDKIELAILLKSKEDKDFAYRSLRFSTPEQLSAVIKDLTKAYFYFIRKRNKLNMQNYHYILNNYQNSQATAAREAMII